MDTVDSRQHVAQWFADYQAPIFRYALRLVHDEERAADIVQETFLRALAALSTQPPPTNASAWLHRIATNLAYNTLRRQNRRPWLRLTGNEPAPRFEGRFATAQVVRHCLAHLRPKEAEALLLYEVVGLSCSEIAGLSGEKVEAIRMRISRARIRFSDLYEKETAYGMS
jgi:RNA polymerase sigma-70 factor (ECF subfamily)